MASYVTGVLHKKYNICHNSRNNFVTNLKKTLTLCGKCGTIALVRFKRAVVYLTVSTGFIGGSDVFMKAFC